MTSLRTSHNHIGLSTDNLLREYKNAIENDDNSYINSCSCNVDII